MTRRDGVLYVAEDAQHPLVGVAAHEWVHNLKRTHPHLYEQLAAEVERQGNAAGYAQRMGYAPHEATEELTAAAVGDAMADVGFLERLAADNLPLFSKVARAFMQYLNGLLTKMPDQGTNAYLQDVAAFRETLIGVIREYEGQGRSTQNGAQIGTQSAAPEATARGVQKSISDEVGDEQVPAYARRAAQDFLAGHPQDMFLGHNITERGLRFALDLGGLAAPSLAISRVGLDGAQDFGSITLLADKNLIGQKDAPTFDADIYSPRQPRAHYKINDAARREFEKQFPSVSVDWRDFERYGVDGLKPYIKTAFFAERMGLVNPVHDYDLRKKTSDYLENKDNEESFDHWAEHWAQKLTAGRHMPDKPRTPYTLDNVVREMTRKIRNGENDFYGTGMVRAAVANPIKSIEQAQKSRHKIIDKQEMRQHQDDASEKLNELIKELKPFVRDSYGDDYQLVTQALAGGMRGVNKYLSLDAAHLQKVKDFYQYLRDLPTDYFEMKVQRAMRLGEFRAAIVPSDIEPDLVDALQGQGVRVIQYQSGNQQSRAEAIAAEGARQDLMFSRRQSVDAPALTLSQPASKEQAQQALAALAGRALVNAETGLTAYINRDQRDKILSTAAQIKSENNGFDAGFHYATAAKIADLWAKAAHVGEFGDTKNDDAKMRIHRFAAPVIVEGQKHYVTILAKETTTDKDGTRIYTLELHTQKTLRSTLGKLMTDSGQSSTPFRSVDDIITQWDDAPENTAYSRRKSSPVDDWDEGQKSFLQATQDQENPGLRPNIQKMQAAAELRHCMEQEYDAAAASDAPRKAPHAVTKGDLARAGALARDVGGAAARGAWDAAAGIAAYTSEPMNQQTDEWLELGMLSQERSQRFQKLPKNQRKGELFKQIATTKKSA